MGVRTVIAIQQRFLKAASFSLVFGLAVVLTFAGGSSTLLRKIHGLPTTSSEAAPADSMAMPIGSVVEPGGAAAELPVSWPTEVPAVPGEPIGGTRRDEDQLLFDAWAPTAPLPANAGAQLSIPRIGLNAAIVEVGLGGGEWTIPRSVVGHLRETVQPGELGNAVFAGHVIAGGRDNIFARLSELTPGDELGFLADTSEQRFRVTEKRLVRNTDVSVLASPRDVRMVTLITCAGNWIASENDYDQRLVVVAQLQPA